MPTITDMRDIAIDKGRELIGKEPRPKDDPYGWVRKAVADLQNSSSTKQLVVGGASGWVSGFVTAKFGKTAATAVGGTILMLHIAQQYGYIKVDWTQVQKDLDQTKKDLEKKARKELPGLIERLQQFAVENVIIAGGFSGGFLLGLASA